MNHLKSLAFAAICAFALGAAVVFQALVLSPHESSQAEASIAPSSERLAHEGDAGVISPSRIERRIIYSESLGQEMRMNVYLPVGYDSAGASRFPVLYMLHGIDGNENAWSVCGLFRAADEAALRGGIPPMIIVTPAGDNGYWVDQANNGPRYGSYVARDLVGLVDKTYRTIPTRQARAVGGMSMGGHGALQLAMNFPDTFGVVGAHSVALRTYEQAFSFFGDRAYFSRHDPVQLFKENRTRASSFRIWIDIGKDDQWYPAAAAFNGQLDSAQIQHEWHVYPGSHDVTYWSAHVAEYLAFYGRSLATQEGS